MRVRGDQNLYRSSVGILLHDTRVPRIPGDITTLVRLVHDAVRHGVAPHLA